MANTPTVRRLGYLHNLFTNHGQFAPDPEILREQGGKVETGFSSVRGSLNKTGRRNLLIEDYVYYAEAQRAAQKLEDSKP